MEDENPYVGKQGNDNYKPLAFYQSRVANIDNGFAPFATDEGQFYFSLKLNGEVLLLSESYTSQDGRNNGMDSVNRNIENAARYQTHQHPNGKYYFNLLAGNNQEIATSVWFDSESDMNSAIRKLQAKQFGATETVVLTTAGDGVEGNIVGMEDYKASINIIEAAPKPKEDKPKKKRKKKSGDAKPKAEKVFLKSGNYHFNGVTYQTMKSGNERYYFSFRDEAGSLIFSNANVRGFETEEEVDAAVQRVLDLGPYEGNYEGKTTTNGKYYFYLKDTEGNNIAKSFFLEDAAHMQSMVGLLIGQLEVAAAVEPEITKTAAVLDDYLACAKYAGEAGFHRFFEGSDESWYFAYNDTNGKTMLRSEGYASEKARENGIESVIKNAPIEERWTTGKDDEGHYFALKAGNHQEIARSCPYESEAAMMAAWNWTRGDHSTIGAGAQLVDGTWMAAAALVVPGPEKAPFIIDDYLPCDRYQGGAGFHRFFNDEDGKWYFSYNDEDGKTLLRSEGYTTEKARENGIESVEKNAPIEARWTTGKDDDGHYYALKAGNHQEIARSCPYESEAAMMGFFGTAKRFGAPVVAAAAALAAVAAIPAVPEVPAKPVDKEDDYMVCNEYKGQNVNDKRNNTALFKHSNGLFYFAIYNEDGSVRLRSEGFVDARDRDKELSGALRNLNNEDMYETIEKGDRYIKVLKDETGREVGRSCLETKKTAPVVVPVVAAAAAVAAAAPIVVNTKKEEKVVPVAAPVAAAASTSGKFPWWLLGLLGLLLLGFLLWKGCNGCNTPDTAAVIAPTPVEAPAVADTVETVVETPPAPLGCNCTSSDNPHFDLSNTGTPKSLTRLGTNPEFGNSHSYDAKGFFDRLGRKYKDATHKEFLDRTFRSMGYANGFSDATAEMFSEVTLTPGTTGNMGYAASHKFLYATLNASGKDLEAFKIKAANGCDVHFMKTCGNFFFVCTK